ncbi:putative lipoprotein [Plesiocystis pacifica SIR-1]|uniref:Putative lipoprotein n=2 Tax=Plesiocystis pacifica TaxID=191768 RepID=A6GDG8_9BACT|nr:putative lipoprotein [Plesiocystis pacifica SIR-1]
MVMRSSPSPTRALVYSVALAALPACLGDNPDFVPRDTGADEAETDTDSTTTDTDTSTDTSSETNDDTTTAETTEETTGGEGCDNGEQDGDETDVDCGGSCAPCDNGGGCMEDTDCASLYCDEGTCAEASCEDGVQNQGEASVDCGGPCALCSGTFVAELDDYESGDANSPAAAMFDDGSFALSFNNSLDSLRVRWFDAEGAPVGLGENHAMSLTHDPPRHAPLVAAPLLDAPDRVQVVFSATAPDTLVQREFFLGYHAPGAEEPPSRVADEMTLSNGGDLMRAGSKTTTVWQADDQVWVRRWDDEIGEGTWTDINWFPAETDPANYTVLSSSIPCASAGPDGIDVVAWVRCSQLDESSCQVVARRIDDDWIDDAPRVLSEAAAFFADVAISRGVDGRTAAAWKQINGPDSLKAQARFLDSELNGRGPVFDLTPFQALSPDPDVEALSDGSFAFVWIDAGITGPRLQRLTAPDTPFVPDLAEEASWPGLDLPSDPALASADGHLVVVWTAIDGNDRQLQGQLFSF